MKSIRLVKKITRSRPTLEGAGVHLGRAFGNADVPLYDPFLMLDDFHSDKPEDYIAGFPWHPHRGIETVTYMLSGTVKHGDSMGNAGAIHSGDVQWMTAGSGIIHQEMPQKQKKTLWGFQLWVNLPAKDKMMKPRYRDVKAQELAEHKLESGARVRVIAGKFKGIAGPVKDIISDPEYLDITVPKGVTFEHIIKSGYTVFAYVFEGGGFFDPSRQRTISAEHVVLFGDGENVVITAQNEPLRFLLISGKPIGEPVAWYGPIVMNTEEELALAFEEYRNGTFIKS
jgi:redox-sensitive bicupin YhaK (pirin superfamily)